MYRVVHVFLGLSTGLLLCSSFPYFLLCGLSGALGAYIPDIKHAPYRRGRLSHSLVLPFVLIAIAYSVENLLISVIVYRLLINVFTNTLYSLSIGWITHVLSDSLTAQGVYILYPFTNYRLRVFKKLRSSSMIGNLSILLLSTILIYIWVVKTGFDTTIQYLLKIISYVLT